MAKAKRPSDNPFQIWIPVLFGHCMIHAGSVFIITASIGLAMIQLISHFVIDYLKCEKFLGKEPNAFVMDQVLHFAVMVLIAILYCL